METYKGLNRVMDDKGIIVSHTFEVERSGVRVQIDTRTGAETLLTDAQGISTVTNTSTEGRSELQLGSERL